MEHFKKVIAILTIFSLVGGVFIFQIEQANSASALLYFLKEFVVYPLVRMLANALENKITNKSNGLISGLIQKSPSFILSWRNFTLDSQARGNDVFRAVLADASLCPYLKTNLQKSFGADKYIGALAGSEVKVGGVTAFQQKTSIPGLPSFQNLTNCSLPSNFNASVFKNDFAKGGGWATWNKLIQPNNNFFGAYSLAIGEQQRQIETELQSSRDKSIAGQGFLGQALGRTGGASPSGCVGASLPGVQRFSANASGNLTNITRCSFLGKEVTPAKVLGGAAASALDKKLGRVGGATQITDVILTLLTSVMSGVSNRMLNFIGQIGYEAPPPYAPEPTPPGGNNFNETFVQPGSDPNVGAGTPGDPNAACSSACQGEIDSCRASIATICTPGPPDPITGEPGPDVCEPDPNGESQCQTQYTSCTNQCAALP